MNRRMYALGVHITERFQHEAALMKARMGKLQGGRIYNVVVTRKQVNVERSVGVNAVDRLRGAPLFALYLLRDVQDGFWGKGGFKQYDGIDKGVVGGEPYRCCGVKARALEERSDARLKCSYSHSQLFFLCSQV